MERSLALVSTDKMIPYFDVLNFILTIPVVVSSWDKNTKFTWSKDMLARGS